MMDSGIAAQILNHKVTSDYRRRDERFTLCHAHRAATPLWARLFELVFTNAMNWRIRWVDRRHVGLRSPLTDARARIRQHRTGCGHGYDACVWVRS